MARIERSRLPSMSEMNRDHTRMDVGGETQEEMIARYSTQLY
jgi:hypothetical protein